MDKKTPYLVLTTPVLLQGGTEYQMLSVIRSLREQSCRIGVLCYYEYDPEIIRLFQSCQTEVVLLNLERGGRHQLFYLFRLFLILFKWFRTHRPDIVNIQYLAPGLIPVFAARLAGIRKILATIHISGHSQYRQKEKVLVRLAAFITDHFICVSQGTERFWFNSSHEFSSETSLSGTKHFTIYNGIDSVKIHKLSSRISPEQIKKNKGIPENQFVIGITGRLAAQKGHRILFEAISLLTRRKKDFILLVIGNGPLEEELKELAQKKNIGNHCYWLGGLPQEQVYQLYGILDLLVMPSLFEGFGLVAAEAMAAGVPVIASDVDGLSEIITHNQNGSLVRPEDPNGLFNEIHSLIENETLRHQYSKKGISTVRARFDIEKFRLNWISLFLKLTSNDE